MERETQEVGEPDGQGVGVLLMHGEEDCDGDRVDVLEPLTHAVCERVVHALAERLGLGVLLRLLVSVVDMDTQAVEVLLMHCVGESEREVEGVRLPLPQLDCERVTQALAERLALGVVLMLLVGDTELETQGVEVLLLHVE